MAGHKKQESFPATSGEGTGAEIKSGSRHRKAEAAELLGARHDGRTLHQITRDLNGSAVFGLGQERSLGPGVEGAHRRATPDLVVHAPVLFACDGPAAGLAQVPAEDQAHAVLGRGLGALDLRRAAPGEEGLGLLKEWAEQ